MVQKITCKVDPEIVNTEKFTAMVEKLVKLVKLGVWVGSEIIYDDSDKELTAKIKEITDAYLA